MTIATRIFTWLKGEPVGRDDSGNRYYREKPAPEGRPERRWVIYQGEAEASRVPPQWHAWLHRTVDEVPSEEGSPKRPWQKPHRPNMTGTPDAYRPPGHVLSGAGRARARSEYESWKPPA
ncbi:MAG: NADH:ubiquinone oxidoreductase subunit NDUFA12 [Defluviicoccus sp.]|nr:NADH:ubiquinone oxidoreductase subunit NDUFA12 [Defluviicoccus sp.]